MDVQGVRVLLDLMAERGASDLILKSESRPSMRVDGECHFMGDTPVHDETIRAVFEEMATDRVREQVERGDEADAAWEVPGIGRFRANIFHHRGTMSIVLRRIVGVIQSIEDLHLPAEPLAKLAEMPRGLVLVTGTAGSGKSTTIAAMIEHVNRTRRKHIVTIEDPIEFLFEDRESVIHQREVGYDTRNFTSALKHIVRQSPDIIYIGEMRDVETMGAAISAAETGHLVMSTLHTINATQTVERIINFFPPHQHGVVRLQLALSLQGVISMRLVPKKGGEGRVPATEIMMATPTVRDLLEEGKTTELVKAVEDGQEYYGSQTFNRSLKRLLDEGLIEVDDAIEAADDPDELKLEIRGIRRG